MFISEDQWFNCDFQDDGADQKASTRRREIAVSVSSLPPVNKSNDNRSAASRLLFASPPPGKIRAVTWLSAAVMLGCIPACYFTLTQMTRMPVSPELASLGARLATAGIIAALGVGFFAGMLVYLTYYTTRLSLAGDADLVHVETLRLFGRDIRTLTVGQIASSSYHHGRLSIPGGVTVDAPWYWVRVRGGRGFLLDAQGTFHDRRALAKVLAANSRSPG